MAIHSFLGIRNTNTPRNVPDNGVWDGCDVELDNAGALLQRPGYTLSKAMPISAAYETRDLTAYVVSNGLLCRLMPDLSLVQIAPTKATAFCDDQRYLFTNDGLMVFDDKAVNLDIHKPSSPNVKMVGGDLPAGQYAIVTTQISPDGLMSAASDVVTVQSAQPFGLDITPDVTPGYTAKIWMTEAYGDIRTGGEVFYSASGAKLPDIFTQADRFPPADLVELYDSRLCCTEIFDQHTVIRFSERNHFHLFNWTSDFIVVPGRVLAMARSGDALFVGTGTEMYSATLTTLDKLANYGVIPGKPVSTVQDSSQLLIHSVRGVCQFSGSGGFSNVTESKCSLPPGAHCHSAILNHRGFKQFLALTGGDSDAFNWNGT